MRLNRVQAELPYPPLETLSLALRGTGCFAHRQHSFDARICASSSPSIKLASLRRK